LKSYKMSHGLAPGEAGRGKGESHRAAEHQKGEGAKRGAPNQKAKKRGKDQAGDGLRAKCRTEPDPDQPSGPLNLGRKSEKGGGKLADGRKFLIIPKKLNGHTNRVNTSNKKHELRKASMWEGNAEENPEKGGQLRRTQPNGKKGGGKVTL